MKKVITLDIISSTNKLTDHFRGSCYQVLHETICAYRSRYNINVLTLELAAVLKITAEREATQKKFVMLLFF